MPSVPRLLRRAQQHLTLNNGVLLIALLLAFVWAWSTVEAIQRNFKLQQQVDSLQQQIAVRELENKTLELQKKYYASDEFIELSARQRLNKAAPGEKLLLLPPHTVAPATEAHAQTTQEVPLADRSNFAQWMYFLFGKKD